MTEEIKEACYQFFLKAGVVATKRDQIVFDSGWECHARHLEREATKQEGAK